MVDKTILIGDIINKNPEYEAAFNSFGMKCGSCELRFSESLEEACMVHGVDCDDLISHLIDMNKN